MSASISTNENDARSDHDQYRAIPSHLTPLYHRTPIGGRLPRLLWLLCADGSESMLALSPLPALALALPVRLRTFMGPLGG